MEFSGHDCTLARTVIGSRYSTSENRVQSRGNPCGICGRRRSNFSFCRCGYQMDQFSLVIYFHREVLQTHVRQQDQEIIVPLKIYNNFPNSLSHINVGCTTLLSDIHRYLKTLGSSLYCSLQLLSPSPFSKHKPLSPTHH